MSGPSELEELAARHVPGCGPVTVDPLGSGLVNHSYRVRRDGRSFSMRLAAPRAATFGLDRVWECRVLQCAASFGLAPAVECCDPGSGLLVSRWVEGGTWSVEQSGTDETLRQVALLARRVHSLPLLDEPRIVSPAEWVTFYRRILAPFPADAQRAPLDRHAQALLEALGRTPPGPPVLCHSDLHVQNLVIAAAGAPQLLDWEYAHVSERFWDLAGWISNGDLAAERREVLLSWYLRREPAAAESVRLGRLAWLYGYVCLLWSEVYSLSEPDGNPAAGAVARRAVQLKQRLGRELSGCSVQVPAH